ncbi:MAG: hypothetical protein FJ304_19485 [Planctomycetes bacterium]|nr:hypothetical protein [Planctomycetota bacterium]
MRYFFCVLFLAATSTMIARGDDLDTFKKAKAPKFVHIQDVDVPKQTLRIIVPAVRIGEVQKQVPNPNGGEPVIITEAVVEHILVPRDVPLKQLRIETADGKKVTGADDVKALKGKTALLATGPEAVAPIFLKMLAKDVVVITRVQDEKNAPEK